MAVGALRFLYKVTLKKDWPIATIIPTPKRQTTLPVVLSQDEVCRLLEAVAIYKKRLNRLNTQEEQAQDFLFELEIAARLAGLSLAVTFDEPDIVLHTSEGERLGLACKRPRNAKRHRKRLPEAAVQVTARSYQGVVVIGVEPLFHRSGDQERPTITYLGDGPMVKAEAYRILDEAIYSAAKEIDAALNHGVAGVLFRGVVTGWARRVAEGRDAYHSQWIHRAISHPDALGLADVLESRLFPGDVNHRQSE